MNHDTQPDMPQRNFTEIAESLGTLTHPDIRKYHSSSIEGWHAGDVTDEIKYHQSILAVLHRFDEARMHKLTEHDRAVTFAGIAFCLADIHYQTGHYLYCAEELAFIRRISTGEAYDCATEALREVVVLKDTVSPHDTSAVRTEISLYS